MRILMSLKTNRVEVLVEAKFVIAQSPQVNVVWKFGDSLDCASKNRDFQSGLYGAPEVYDDLQGVHVSENIILGLMRCKWGSTIP
ncbi:hypothetical protein TNCV_4188591 [Trichonephila clavipes]|nr:hypothetical protein TNCV_4188591 [Trichonephila clavipes]